MRVLLHLNIYKDIGVKLEKKHRNDQLQKSVKTGLENTRNIFWNQNV